MRNLRKEWSKVGLNGKFDDRNFHLISYSIPIACLFVTNERAAPLYPNAVNPMSDLAERFEHLAKQSVLSPKAFPRFQKQ